MTGAISGLCIGLLLMGCARAAAPSYATHGAWSVACDNTLSCDARGFDEDSNTGAEVVFARAAGPAARGTVTLYAPLARTAVRVDDRMLVLPDAAWVYAGDGASLTTDRPAAVAAFIDALRHGAALHVGADAGPVPLDGMVAALSGIDDRQGRAGGRTALVQHGPRRTSAVPAAPVPPRPARRAYGDAFPGGAAPPDGAGTQDAGALHPRAALRPARRQDAAFPEKRCLWAG
ncbi:DUF1176 domain-containing protein [Gluconacetobacter entanii]|uniref:DUF1176 domain-containing protein n=1 Tax=Gluconacetobacter entanii TaxID=108528 RepID=UPI001C931E1D|nr:DUF1176 domain-containing protein [Gluconacetobacter entanii]MBY4638918.1 DUF1176 domain-containing protein [Gluconacetobacter entanii]MCW4579590.1 DUF1176 domain-containing protein [Gluconacetobacter entanii]MCW4582996.1 DUF1176 domain-containing protein [Gluconacetobacter entanii]MCW4586374.1 DUF1176 domain-containing protein [Gluconacetobacter entanii]